jgi:putative lysine transport system permease protein
MVEILRGGISSVDKGQFEAGRSLGLSQLQVMIYVVFKQAIKNSLPAIGNELVINVKDTSVLSVIMIVDLFRVAQIAQAATFQTFACFIIVAVIYLIITYILTRILRYIERRMNLTEKPLPSSY